MSAIIAICGNNFCSFVADSRSIIYNKDDGTKSVNENFQTIVKLNSKVLFGASGTFEASEHALSPLDIYPDRNEITPEMARTACENYLKTIILSETSGARSYLVGGKDENGCFCMYELSREAGREEATIIKRVPSGEQDEILVSCILPAQASQRNDEIRSKAAQSVADSTYHREMLKKIALIISDLARTDESVGNHIITASVTK